MASVSVLSKIRSLLMAVSMLLICVGIVMIYSASSVYAMDVMKDSAYFLKRHLIYVFIGMFLGWVCSKVDYEKLRSKAKIIFCAAAVMLVLVLIPHVGHATGGARRWFRLGFITFQPSEFMKLAMIFYMADFLDRKAAAINDIKRVLLPALFVLGIAGGLILKQPDLGTAVTIVMVVLFMFFAAGVSLRYLATLIIVALPGFIYMLISKPYRRKRLLAFFHPWDDPRGVGYQITQSFLALGSGGLFGVGLGESQQKMFFLPESHTDFIFSIIGEELGLLGAGSVIVLFMTFIFAGMVIVFQCKTRFTQLFSLGLVCLIALEVVINIGVSIGALPTKGLSLPFISYGGTALLVNMMAVGFLANIATRAQSASSEDL